MPRKYAQARKQRGKKRNTNFKRKVMAIVRPLSDNRYTYSTIGATGVSDSGAYLTGAQLLDTTLGDGTFAERQGDVVTPTRIIMRYRWDFGDERNLCRLILFQWKPDSNSFPPTAILNNVIDVSTLGSASAPLSRYVYDQKNFHILYDSTVMVSQNDDPILARTVNIYGKKLHPIRYTNGVSLGHNNIYALVLSDSSIVAHPTIAITLEMHYKA